MEKQKQDMVGLGHTLHDLMYTILYGESVMEEACLLGRRYFGGKEKDVCIGRLCRWSL